MYMEILVTAWWSLVSDKPHGHHSSYKWESQIGALERPTETHYWTNANSVGDLGRGSLCGSFTLHISTSQTSWCVTFASADTWCHYLIIVKDIVLGNLYMYVFSSRNPNKNSGWCEMSSRRNLLLVPTLWIAENRACFWIYTKWTTCHVYIA